MDNISRLFQLQASNKHAVVSEELNFTNVQENLYIKTDIDQYLINSCIKAKEHKKPFLYVVSGNAGDGKSMQIKKGRQQLLNFLEEEEIDINYDATQVDNKMEDLTVKLFDFFDNFLKSCKENKFKVYIIAMNIGIAIRFFNDVKYKDLQSSSDMKEQHNLLKGFILNELNIELLNKQDRGNICLLENVEVINFDHRVLVKYHIEESNSVKESFFSKMIMQIQYIFKSDECQICTGKDKCPVFYNVKALQQPEIRKKIENILFKVFLFKKVHFTPRNLWDLLFNLTVGGTNKYLLIKNESDTSPCETFRNLPEEKSNNFTFYNNMYDVETDNVIIKFIQNNLSKFDPYYLNNRYLELNKIFYQANSDKYVESLKENLKTNNNFKVIGPEILHLPQDTKRDSENLEKIIRFIYFHNTNEKEIGDLLYNDPSQVINKESFLNFIESLQNQYIKYTEEGIKLKLNKELVKNLKAALTNIFGTKLKDGSRYFQLETVSTRGKGRLYSGSNISIPLDIQDESYLLNDNHIKYIDSFPSTLKVKVNSKLLEIDYQLYEMIILSSKGYNISSVDLDKFFNLKNKSKSLFTSNNEKKEIIYEYENKYFKLHYNEDEYENEFIGIN